MNKIFDPKESFEAQSRDNLTRSFNQVKDVIEEKAANSSTESEKSDKKPPATELLSPPDITISPNDSNDLDGSDLIAVKGDLHLRVSPEKWASLPFFSPTQPLERDRNFNTFGIPAEKFELLDNVGDGHCL